MWCEGEEWKGWAEKEEEIEERRSRNEKENLV